MTGGERNPNDVDLYRGRVSLSIPLAQLPGPNGLELSIAAYYSSDVLDTATVRNIERSTGILGLGWSLPQDAIVVDYRDGVGSPAYRLASHDGGGGRLFCTGRNPDGTLAFACENHSFRRITYDPAARAWRIVRETGDLHVYGGADSDPTSIEWRVAWGNWTGASAVVDAQVPVPLVFHLSSISNRFGDRIRLEYESAIETVGSGGEGEARPFYTRACYLRRIRGAAGDVAELNYGEKTYDDEVREYQDPHTDPAPPNAYQDRFETRFLDTVTVHGPDGDLLYTRKLVYADAGGAPAFLGEGDFAKRLLLAVVRTDGDSADSLPPPRFVYYGTAPEDGVSADSPYNATTQALYGALKGVTTPAGGSVTYRYASVSAALSVREADVAPPSDAETTFSRPVFHFEDDYVVATWLGSDDTLRVKAFWWDGRWLAPGQSPQLDTVPLAGESAYATTPVACADRVFGIYSRNQVHLYGADPFRPGQWAVPSVDSEDATLRYFPTEFADGEPVTLAAGAGIAAALGRQRGRLYRYRFDGAAWSAADPVELTAGAADACFECAAAGNGVFAVATARTRADDPVHVSLHHLDETGQWRAASFLEPRPQARVDSCAIFASSTFALCEFRGVIPTGTTVSYQVFWWSPDRRRLYAQSLAQFEVAPDAVPTPYVGGSFIALGEQLFRFDGSAWSYENVHGAGELQDVRYGVDTVLRVIHDGSQYTYSLRRYDPNTGAWTWERNATEDQGAKLNLAAADTRGVSPFLVFADVLYAQKPDGTFESTGVTLPGLSGDDARSAALPGGRYLVYQHGGQVVVRVIRNGGALDPVTLPDRSVYCDASPLTGRQAFVSYTGSYGESDSTLALHRVVADAPAGAIIAYPVATAAVDNGYATVSTAFAFDGSTALARADGGSARYNRATTAVGSTDPEERPHGRTETYYFNGLSPDETPALPYPVDAERANASAYYGFACGLPYAERTLPAGSETPDSETLSFWWVSTMSPGGRGTGAYVRRRKVRSQVDGVAAVTTSDFDPLTGLVTRTDVGQRNARGVAETLTSLYRYFWEIYDPGRDLNLLTPIIQFTTRTADGSGESRTIGNVVTTYRDDWGHGTGQWAPDRLYRARSADAPPFDRWQPSQGDPDGWLRTSTITARNARGQPVAVANAFAVPTSLIYDDAGIRVAASLVNADAGGDEAAYLGFESYEATAGWGWSDPSRTLRDFITTADAHAGERSLLLPPVPDRTVGPVRLFSPVGQARSYLFGAWVKTEAGFDPAQGDAAWQIDVYTADSQARQIGMFTLPFGDTENRWSYRQHAVDLAALRVAASLPPDTPLVLRIAACNRNAAKEAFVDDLRFSPLDARFSATVFDAATRFAAANLATNGETFRVVRDRFRRIVAAVGPGEAVKAVASESPSRAQSGVDAFLPEFPNSTLGLSTTSASRYYDFRDHGAADWTFHGAGGAWAIAGGRLAFTGTTTDPLGSTAVLDVIAFTNFAVRVVCASRTADAGVGNGDVFVFWDEAAGAYKLVRRNLEGPPTLIHASAALGFRDDWVFAIVDGVVLFFAGGVQLFAYDYQDPDTGLPDVGKVALLATRDAAFDDLVVLNDPQLSMTFRDGFGTRMQSVSLLGRSTGASYPTIAQGRLFDEIGRPYVVRNAGQPLLAVDLPAAADDDARYLVEGGESTYLVAGSGRPLTRSQYLDGVYGFDYTKRVYESSPLSRVLKLILPREKDQDEQHFTLTTGYGPATATLIQGILPDGTDPGDYHAESITDPNGTTTYRVYTALGQLVAVRTAVAEDALHTRAVDYDAAGNVATVFQPNHFQPPAGSTPGVWVESRTYTFNNLLARRTTPDTGTASYLYDALDRLRFEQDADGAAASPPRFVYHKYDDLDRLVETGYIQDAGVTWPALEAKVDERAYPDLSVVAGDWRKRIHYDIDDGGNAGNLVDRVWKVEVNAAASGEPDTQVFAYDDDGYVIRETSVVQGHAPDAYVTAYTYDNLKNVTVLAYPAKTGETPFEVGYYYDRLGRLAAVGKPVDPGAVVDPSHPATGDEALYAAYAYLPGGALAAEALNNRSDGDRDYAFLRAYGYNQPGRLRTISDPFFAATLDYYEQPGYAGVHYYNGEVSRTTCTFPMGGAACPPAAYGYLYGYDRLGRLEAAQNTLDDAFSVYAGPAGYDANGNRTSLRHGATTLTYSYHESASSQEVTNNRLLRVTASASSAVDFSATPSIWRWGASNAGPSASVVREKEGGGAYLELAGGSLGHYEYLEAGTYIDPAGTYRLACSVRTPAGYAEDTGAAGWYLALGGAAGRYGEVRVAAIPDTGGEWQDVEVPSIDVASLVASLGLGEPLVSASIQLRNYRRKKTGVGAGSSFDVATVTLETTAEIVGEPFAYRPAGGVQAAPDRAITSIDYDPVTGLTSGITVDGATVRYAYDGRRGRSLETGPDLTRVYLRGSERSPLRIRTTTGGEARDLFLIYGANGILAYQPGSGPHCFTLKDPIGSTRVVVDASNQVVAALDYLPSGAVTRESGSPGTDYLYAGQARSRAGGLYDFGARLYDPGLGRFYAADPVRGGASPYPYAANDPVGSIDPGGNAESGFDWIWTSAGSVAAAAGFVASTLASAALYRESLRIGREPLRGGGSFAGAVALGYVSSATLACLLDRSDFSSTWYGSWWNELTDLDKLKQWEKDESGFLRKRLYDVLKNFSRQEAAVVIRHFPFPIGLLQIPWTLVYNYHWLTADAMAKYWSEQEFQGNPRGANAVRHIVWMCGLRRKWTPGFPGFAAAYGEAHEVARGNIDPTDSLADTLNNELARHYAVNDPRDCVDIAFSLWRDGVLAQNAEGSNLDNLSSREQNEIAASFERAAKRFRELGLRLPRLPATELAEVKRRYHSLAAKLEQLYANDAAGPQGGPAAP